MGSLGGRTGCLMSERSEADLIVWFRKQVYKRWQPAFFYKIPDTFGLGGMRPFDVVIIAGGKTFCLEFKKGKGNIPTKFQAYSLDLAERSGASVGLVNELNKEKHLKKMEDIIDGK